MRDPAAEAVMRHDPTDPFDERHERSPSPRTCEVCGGELAPRERKVHAGTCARVRDTLLQRRRRQSKRIARGDGGA